MDNEKIVGAAEEIAAEAAVEAVESAPEVIEAAAETVEAADINSIGEINSMPELPKLDPAEEFPMPEMPAEVPAAEIPAAEPPKAEIPAQPPRVEVPQPIQYNPPTAFYAPEPVVETGTAGKGLAIGSLILGIASIFFSFSVVLSFLCVIGAIIGIVMARSSKKKGYTGGMATGGLVTSIIGLVLSLIFTVSCIACTGCFACLASDPDFQDYMNSGEFEQDMYDYMDEYMVEYGNNW